MPGRAEDRALLMYDGDCAFCRLWVDAWKSRTGERVIYATSKEIAKNYPDIPPEKYRRAVQLVDADGARYEGAAAIFRLLAKIPGRGWMNRLYVMKPVAGVSEWAYRLVASHRTFFLKLTHLMWGKNIETPRYGLTARVFMQALAVVYLFAFISLYAQLPGLVGQQGLSPAGEYLAAVKAHFGGAAYWYAPTLAWLGSHAGALQFMAIVGALASLLAIGGILTVPCFLIMWALYLSLAVAGQDFMSFQWDSLLLEAGFLAIFLTPLSWTSKYASRVRSSPLVVWLYRFLLFRLLFSSGISKLLSGDLAWKNLTALQYHFETQPLPTPLAWYAHHLPAWFLKLSTLATLGIEVIVPFLFFLPRRARALGAGLTAFFQLLMIATGNFAFFNWLTLALCLFLIDDSYIERLFPKMKMTAAPEAKPEGRLRVRGLGALAALIVFLGLSQVVGLLSPMPAPIRLVEAAFSPLRIVNGYGLFPVMTTRRQEIVMEGSNDGVNWKEYVFRDKPGDVKRAPAFVAPYQPRLDWQMWFAALDNPGQDVWFTDMMFRLLQGSKPVLALFEKNPFPDAPPVYMRATLYNYRFTTPDERKADGAWWRRQMRVEYFPTVSLRSFTGAAQ